MKTVLTACLVTLGLMACAGVQAATPATPGFNSATATPTHKVKPAKRNKRITRKATPTK
jgi:hypothetical protein